MMLPSDNIQLTDVQETEKKNVISIKAHAKEINHNAQIFAR